MMIEVPRHQGDIDVARLADRLAVVHGFQDRQETLAFLDQPGNGIEMLCPGMSRQLRPGPEGLARGFDCGIDIAGRALRHRCQPVARGGIHHREARTITRCNKAATDEVAKALVMGLEPVHDRR